MIAGAAAAALSALKSSEEMRQRPSRVNEEYLTPEKLREAARKRVIPAPQWLKDRMAALRAMPPPTIEEVRTAWAASAKWQEEYGFECVEKIKKAKYIR